VTRRIADVVVTEEAPDSASCPIATTDELPEEEDGVVPVFVDPEIARLALCDDIKPLWP
jgi:hypothetical protein